MKNFIVLGDPALKKYKKNNIILNMLCGLEWKHLTQAEKDLFTEKEVKEFDPKGE